jgi:AraC-like DNA-binding protein
MDPTPTNEAMIAPVFLVRIVAEAVRQHVDPGPLFRGLEIEAADLERPGAMVSHGEATTVVRRSLALLALANQGLTLGMGTRITERGVLALGLLAAATLGDAIGLLLHHPQSAGCLVQLRDAVEDGSHQLIAEGFLVDQDMQDFLVDLTFTAHVVLRRQVTACPCTPSAVEFVRATPADPAAYQAFFGCPVRFGCLRNVLSTPPPQLLLALPWANGMAFSLSLRLLERESNQLNRMLAVGRTVERALRRCLPRIAALTEVAASMNVSERTLRRQLTDAGLSYRMLLDDSRKSRALDLMAGGHRSMAQVAEQAGFSDARAFARAFRRWTGHSPTSVEDGFVGLLDASPTTVY